MKTHRWCLVLVFVLLLMLLRLGWRWHELNTELDSIYMGHAIVKVVDADSKEPLRIMFRSPGRGPDQRLPLISVGTEDESSLRVHWVATGPVEVGVAAKGYPERKLQLDRHSEHLIVVPLRQ